VDAVVSVAHDVEKLGVVVAAALAAVVVLTPNLRARGYAGLGALALTPVLLVAEIWNTPQFRPIRDRPALAVAAAVLAVLAVLAAAKLIERRPLALPIAAVAVLPFRVPIASGGETAKLLVPLYLVVAAGALAFALADLRGEPLATGGDGNNPPRRGGWLERLLLGFVLLYAVQGVYSSAFSKALEQVVFFYVPFALLYGQLVRYTWTPRLLKTCLAVLAGLAIVFSLVGFVEYSTRTLLLNPKVISTNEFQSYFRVNSLFFDPNIFGRFLVVVMTMLGTALLWARARRDALALAAALAVLWGGLVLTLSQSSLGALLVGLAVVGALRYRARWAATLAFAAVLLGAAFVIAFPSAVRLKLTSEQSVSGSTSGRSDLIRGGLELFGKRPLQGWGSGAFEREYRRHRETSSETAAAASHTIPITVAVEQGVVGLVVYLALLAAAFGRLLAGARGSPARAAIAGAFAALVVHTFLYAAFLEDPLSWVLLAVGAALALPVRRGAALPSAACTAT
jgi:O-antigen ligase